jgi:hypothetical protein
MNGRDENSMELLRPNAFIDSAYKKYKNLLDRISPARHEDESKEDSAANIDFPFSKNLTNKTSPLNRGVLTKTADIKRGIT